MRTRRSSVQGLTIIELLIVISIIGIVAGIGVIRLDPVRYRADAAVRGLAAELSKAQRLAVSLQHDVRVTVADSARLRIHFDADNDGAEETGERVQQTALEGAFLFDRGAAGDVPSPVDPEELTAVTFRRDGTASRGGTFYLTSPGDAACKYCRAVGVLRGTGRAIRFSRATGAWRPEN